MADLKSGAAELDGKRYAAAITLLEPLGKRLPKLADYAAWMLASSQFGLKNYAAVPKILEAVWKHTPSSPLTAKAAFWPRKPMSRTARRAMPWRFCERTTLCCRNRRGI